MEELRREFQSEIPPEVGVALTRVLLLLHEVRSLAALFALTEEFGPIVPLVQIPLSCHGTAIHVPGYPAGWEVQVQFAGPVQMTLKIGWNYVSFPHLHTAIIFWPTSSMWQTSGGEPIRSLVFDEARLVAFAPEQPVEGKLAVLRSVGWHSGFPTRAAQ